MGFVYVAGCDEVGRGCLAGPVVAAAVVLDPDRYIPRICDSKTVTALEREKLYRRITREAVCWSVVGVEPEEIDRINIHQASLRAMQRAVLSCVPVPDMVLVDAFRIPELPVAQRRVVHGDARCTAIAAASIVAKVTRDRDDRAARAGSALRVRSPQGLRHAGPPRRGVAVRLFRGPPAFVPAAHPV